MRASTTVVITLAAVSSGMLAGLFFTWSNAVLPGLTAVDPRTATQAMTSANEVIQNPAFGLLFMGALPLLLLAAVAAGLERRWLAAGLLAVGAVIVLVGVLGVTFVVNLPLNDALAASDGSAQAWSDFTARWQPANVIRTVASTSTSILAVLALAAR